jgi:hypothetical protein
MTVRDLYPHEGARTAAFVDSRGGKVAPKRSMSGLPTVNERRVSTVCALGELRSTAFLAASCPASFAPLVSVSSAAVACSFPCPSYHPCLPCLLLFSRHDSRLGRSRNRPPVANALFTIHLARRISGCKLLIWAPCRTRTCDLLIRRLMQVPDPRGFFVCVARMRPCRCPVLGEKLFTDSRPAS